MKKIISLIALLFLAGCGNNSTENQSNPPTPLRAGSRLIREHRGRPIAALPQKRPPTVPQPIRGHDGQRFCECKLKNLNKLPGLAL
jgi:hypothetical protein